jgi:phage baseplate assembly protein W
MAIRDTSKKPYIIDNDTDVFVGLDLPIRKGTDVQGYFASTTTTIEAVKNNIRNLLQTNTGERLFYPTFGMDLRQFLFDTIDETTTITIQENIIDTFSNWLPFVEIRDIVVNTESTNASLGSNMISISIVFNIVQDPNTIESVTISIEDETTDVSTGNY